MIETTRRGAVRGLLSLGIGGLAATATGKAVGAPIEGRKLRIALSNSNVGSKWRLEMENVFKAALLAEPYRSQVEGSWFNSGNDVTKQAQQISNLVAQGVDAILVDAASPTGLNGVIREASARGILVIAFDNLVTAPSALKIVMSQEDLGRSMAEWLATKLGGKGNVLMVTGVPGTQVDQDRNRGADSVWSRFPDLKIANRFSGSWDSSVCERNTAAVLTLLPQIDGLWCSGGTDGVLKAFVAAGRQLPPTAGESENGFRKFMLGYNGHKCDGFSSGTPPFLSVVALELARRVLRQEYPRRDVTLPLTVTTSDDIAVGKTVFPDQADSFYDNFTGSGANPIVDLCLDAALYGKGCADRLVVNLPNG